VLKDKAIQWEAENVSGRKPVHQKRKSSSKQSSVGSITMATDEPNCAHQSSKEFQCFFSLFDDNPAVKRTFCPPPQCYDPRRMPTSNTASRCLHSDG